MAGEAGFARPSKLGELEPLAAPPLPEDRLGLLDRPIPEEELRLLELPLPAEKPRLLEPALGEDRGAPDE